MQKYLVFLSFLSSVCSYAMFENSMLVGFGDGEENTEEIVYKNVNEDAQADKTIQLSVVRARCSDKVTISSGGYHNQIEKSGGEYYYNATLLQDKARYLNAFFDLSDKEIVFIRQTGYEIEGKYKIDRKAWLSMLDKVNEKK